MFLLENFKVYNYFILFALSLIFMIVGVNASEFNNDLSSGVVSSGGVDTSVVSSGGVDTSVVSSDGVSNLSTTANSVKSTRKVYTFKDLQNKISKSNSSYIILSGIYKYNKNTDSKIKSLVKGVVISKSLRIIGNGCTIDGNNIARCLCINSNLKVILENINIINGYPHSYNGGGVYCKSNVDLTIKNCRFKNNKVYNRNGGALWAGSKSNIKIYNSVFEKNTSIRVSKLVWNKFKRGMGGALCVGFGSNLKLVNSSFKNNKAYLSTILLVSYDDRIYKRSNLYVKHCRFKNNTSRRRGVIYLDELGEGRILDSIFVNNHSPDSAGTLVLDASKEVLVKNCKFIANTGVNGAAIFLDKFKRRVSHVKLINCKFISNVASKTGGAIYSNGGILTIKNCLFKHNKCKGSSIYLISGKLTIKKSKSNKIIVIAPQVTKKFKDKGYFKITIKYKNTKKLISNIRVKIQIIGKKINTIYKKTNHYGVIKISTKSLKKGNYNVKITSVESNRLFNKKSKIIIK